MIKGLILPIILGLMIAIIPIDAEKNNLHEYEINLITRHGEWEPEDAPDRVRGFELIVDGLPVWKNYKCLYYDDDVCQLIFILQNEKMIAQNEKMIEQNEDIILLLEDIYYKVDTSESWLQ